MDEKIRFIAMVNDSDVSFAEACRRCGVSRKTGYKWAERYEQLGPDGLKERMRAAHVHPHATPIEVVDVIVGTRKGRPTWGPKKLHAWLSTTTSLALPAVSTIGEILKRNGLIRPRRVRLRAPLRLAPLSLGEHPNDVWCVDFKGHFALGDKSRCHPLTVTDHASRYLLRCEGMNAPKHGQVRRCMESVFREFGMPMCIRSDNGVPFATVGVGGLSELAVWWIKLGIVPERIDPGEPQQNGRHERMHRTLKAETTKPPGADLTDQQRLFDRFRHVYNDERPHEALGQKAPRTRYCVSRRPMPERLATPEYPDTMLVRKLDESGRMRCNGAVVTVSRLLAKEPVGLEPMDEDRWRIFYGPLPLADVVVHRREARLESLRPHNPSPTTRML